MQRLGSLVKTIAGVDESYAEVLSHPYVKQALSTYQTEVDINKVPSFISALNEYATNLDKCNGCSGLTECRQSINGHFPSLEPKLGRLHLTYQPCKYYESQKYLQNMEGFRVPKSMQSASLITLDLGPAREQFFNYAIDFIENYDGKTYKKGLFIHGNYGSGKTYALCLIANELAKRGHGVGFIFVPEFIGKLKANFGAKSSVNEEFIEKVKNLPILMLDDINSVSVTGWLRDEVLGRILDYRMMNELPTFFSSNANYETLLENFEDTARVGREPVKARRVLERIKALTIPVELRDRNYREHNERG